MKNLFLATYVLIGFLRNKDIAIGEKIPFILLYFYDMGINIASKNKLKVVHFFKMRKFLYFGNHNNLLLDHIHSNLTHYSYFYKKADVVLDVGASFGSFALMVNYCNPKAKIFSFEPSKESFDILKKNCYNIKNVELIESAVGSVNKSVNFYHDKDYPEGSHISTQDTNQSSLTYQVEQITLDSFVKKKKIKKISLLKIDTEGYESQVLKGGINALAISESLIVETDVNLIDNLINVLNYLRRYNFTFVRIGTINYHKNGNIGSLDLIFLKNHKILNSGLLNLI